MDQEAARAAVRAANTRYVWPKLANPPRCVLALAFHCNLRAGISDTKLKVRHFLMLACSLGCALEVPRPRDMLDEFHNSGTRIGPNVTWSRYFNSSAGAAWEYVLDVPPDRAEPAGLHNLPEGGAQFDLKNVELPSVDQLRDWLASHPNSTLRLNFGRCNYWLPLNGQPPIKQWVEASAATGPYQAECICTNTVSECGEPSGLVIQHAATVAKAVMGAAKFVVLHLRRGDRLPEYAGAYEGCADVSAVLFNALRVKKLVEGGLHKPITGILVMTDERDSEYLLRLRSDLQVFFELVRFETDVPSHLVVPNDNYFNFAVLMQICEDNYCIEHRADVPHLQHCERLERPFAPAYPPSPIRSPEHPPLPPPPSLPPVVPPPTTPPLTPSYGVDRASALAHAEAVVRAVPEAQYGADRASQLAHAESLMREAANSTEAVRLWESIATLPQGGVILGVLAAAVLFILVWILWAISHGCTRLALRTLRHLKQPRAPQGYGGVMAITSE